MASRREVEERAAVRRAEVWRRHREGGEPLSRLAEEAGVSRQAVHKVWKAACEERLGASVGEAVA